VIEDSKDRRQFYRINDKVSLSYRVVQAKDIEQEIAKTSRRQRELSDLRNAVHAVDARFEVINMKLSQDNPLIAEALNLFSRKIALHERMLGIDDYDEHVFSEAKEINLSASGAAYNAETPLSIGMYLKMELVTYPEHHYIPVFAQVVLCNQLRDGGASGYHIAVEFKGISEADEERIINHIFKVQAEGIKRDKQAKETESEENSSEKHSTGLQNTASA
jgi:c-di-GMP-binding flagellar brake protein YcgR